MLARDILLHSTPGIILLDCTENNSYAEKQNDNFLLLYTIRRTERSKYLKI